MSANSVNWSALLSDAVNKPGIISQAYSVFHAYSVGNQMLAYSQCVAREIPIGPIATFKRWQSLGRNVKRGSKAIQLCMPVTINKKDENGDKTGDCFQAFVLRNNWFVLDQTEGEDYEHETPSPDWKADVALSALDITQVAFEHPDGNCQGFAKGRCVAISPIAALPHKTRFHEIAHVILGHTSEGEMSDNDRTPRDIREVEAESVAYLCCAILGLPGLDESRGYIQSWLHGDTISDKSAQRIFGAAEKIIKAGKTANEVQA